MPQNYYKFMLYGSFSEQSFRNRLKFIHEALKKVIKQ